MLTELTITPAVFVPAIIALCCGVFFHSPTLRNIGTMFLALGLATAFMMSNPIGVADTITKMWHVCHPDFNDAAKTCRIKFGPKEG